MFIEKGPFEGGPELLYEGHRSHLINQQFLFRVRHRLFEVAKMHNGSGSYVAKLKNDQSYIGNVNLVTIGDSDVGDIF